MALSRENSWLSFSILLKIAIAVFFTSSSANAEEIASFNSGLELYFLIKSSSFLLWEKMLLLQVLLAYCTVFVDSIKIYFMYCFHIFWFFSLISLHSFNIMTTLFTGLSDFVRFVPEFSEIAKECIKFISQIFIKRR